MNIHLEYLTEANRILAPIAIDSYNSSTILNAVPIGNRCLARVQQRNTAS